MGDREVDSKCGIFIAYSLHDVYNGLISLQHRGQDSSGIVYFTRNKNCEQNILKNINIFKLKNYIFL